jgi:hypothetical protein
MTVTIFRAREVLPAPDGPAMPTIMVLLFLLRSNCRQLASKVGKKKKKESPGSLSLPGKSPYQMTAFVRCESSTVRVYRTFFF